MMEQLKLRCLEAKDYKVFHAFVQRNTMQLKRYFPITLSENMTLAQSEEYLNDVEVRSERREFYPFGIFNGDRLIGMFYAKNFDWRIPKCELAYFVDQKEEGKGIISKMLKEFIQFCFNEFEMHKVWLKIDVGNLGSKRVAEKNGFILKGVLKDDFRIDSGELVDVCYYELLAKSS